MTRKLSTTFNRIIALSPVNEVAVLPSKEELDEARLSRLKQSFGFPCEVAKERQSEAQDQFKREQISHLRQRESVFLVDRHH